MALIQWREEFSVGIPGVDHEHRELIALINKLYETIDQPGSELTVMDFLGEIYAQISAHFAFEEKEMRERNYDQYADHKDDHERLLDELRDIMDQVEDAGVVEEADLAQRLSSWFTDHFKTKDARLHKFLK